MLGVPFWPCDVKGGRFEVHLIPSQVHHPQAVPVGYQHHGGIPAAVAVCLGGVDQPFDLGLRKMLTGPQVGVRPSARSELFVLRLGRPA